MTIRFRALAAIALAIVASVTCSTAARPTPTTAVSIAPATPPPETETTRPTVPPPTSVAASPTRSTGSLALGSAQQYPISGDLDSDLNAFADSVVWSSASAQAGTSRPSPGQIRELALPGGTIRTVYAANDPNAAVDVKASASWNVWLEATDRFAFSDGRLLAAPRAGAPPIVIDDLRRYANRTLFPMWFVDGVDLYWSIPVVRDGRPNGPLLHKRLPDGPTETLVAADPGQIVALPSAYAGYLVYEIRSDQAETRVALRRPDGSTTEIATAASEPTVGDGFVVYKRARLNDPGNLAAFVIASGQSIDLGPGEQPRASAHWVAWGRPAAPGEENPYMHVFVARPAFGCIAPFDPPLPNRNSSVGIPSFAGDTASWLLSNFDAPESQRRALVLTPIRDLRC